MGVHPQFHPITSTCINCAAFRGEHLPEHGIASGECHRFAPRATPDSKRIRANTDAIIDETHIGKAIWPLIDGELTSCLDWHPLNYPDAP